jgi:hypothetical protein
MELCTYCFNQKMLENADLELTPCLMCTPTPKVDPRAKPRKLAIESIKKVFGEKHDN